MSAPVKNPLDWRRVCQEALDLWTGYGNSISAVARLTGMSTNAVSNRTKAAIKMGLKPRFPAQSLMGLPPEEAKRRVALDSIPPVWDSRETQPAAAALAPEAQPAAKPRFRLKADGTLEEIPAEAAPREDPPLAMRERVRLEDEITRLRRELKLAHRDDLDAEQVREVIFGLAEAESSPPGWLVRQTPAGSYAGVPVTMWSDWHWGEIVRPEEVGGVNKYNMEIARIRARRLVERTIDICYSHTVGAQYPGIVVCLGGDFVSGDIHEELKEEGEAQTPVVLIDLLGVLVWALKALADKFGHVFCPCVVGNHGRMTRKPRAKGRAFTNYEWLLYTMLDREFKDDPRVQFFIPTGTDAHFKVNSTRYMLTHGDALGVKGGSAIIGALGPIARGSMKTRDSEAQINREIDVIVMGHWHQYLMLPEAGIVVNGSLVGMDEFARVMLRAKYQPPIQALWFDHPKRGITSRWPVLLEDRIVSDDNKWVSWPEVA